MYYKHNYQYLIYINIPETRYYVIKSVDKIIIGTKRRIIIHINVLCVKLNKYAC